MSYIRSSIVQCFMTCHWLTAKDSMSPGLQESWQHVTHNYQHFVFTIAATRHKERITIRPSQI